MKIIVAMTEEGLIGIGDKIPWHYSEDLKRFKQLTLGSTIIMGRKTWDSLKNKPLINRTNIVLSRNVHEGIIKDGAIWFKSIESALEYARGEIYFIGGSETYKQAMNYVDELDITHIPEKFDLNNKDNIYFPIQDIKEKFTFHSSWLNQNDKRIKHTIYKRK